MSLLSVDLSVDYRTKPGALEGVRFEIEAGEAFGLVGESGAGKSTIALALLRLLDMRGGRAHGSILFEGRDLLGLKERELRRIRGRRMAMVPQSPVAALNPALRLEAQLREAWTLHAGTRWREARPRVRELLAQMGLPAEDAFLRRYPHEVSVGQAQRVLIGMAVLHRPALLIADEPTSALDPVSAREILALFARLNRQYSMAMLYISHDLASVDALCTRVAVLAGGRCEIRSLAAVVPPGERGESAGDTGSPPRRRGAEENGSAACALGSGSSLGASDPH